ncbi:MAG: nucleotidyltransferase domain-containing protein [Gemmatimonadales bacterium]
MSSVEIKSIDLHRVRESVDRYARAILADRSEVEEIVVFGSFANATFVPGSDLDIFLLLSHSERSVWDRIPDYLPGAFPVGVDLFPYTRDEIERLRPSSLLDAVAASSWRYARP